MSIIKNLLIAIIALVVVLAVVGLFLSPSAHVERDIVIDAPPAAVFALVNDHREFLAWSPWADYDPDTRYVYAGPASGVGAAMTWESEHPQVGTGSSEIIESEPPRLVRVALDFGAQGTAIAFYRLNPVDGGTHITWGFDTEFGFNLIQRYFGLMLDSWVGTDYEKGLAKLKTVAESRARATG